MLGNFLLLLLLLLLLLFLLLPLLLFQFLLLPLLPFQFLLLRRGNTWICAGIPCREPPSSSFFLYYTILCRRLPPFVPRPLSRRLNYDSIIMDRNTENRPPRKGETNGSVL